MRKLTLLIFFVLSFQIYGKESREIIKPQKKLFTLSDVNLTDSPFRKAMLLDEVWLLSFEPNRFLSGFRTESGLESKAPKYGGWESQGVAGQTFGHYLSALSMMYASTGNNDLRQRIEYSVNELDTCQQVFDLH
ncbi:beta-L-arabinofuranosidase domain-containing protein, partial [Dysgonomonas capnocytophagoides]|uniref:beta-L-arabinofuranosidase domain-containing protein n=1 Tax=Dysgonomonas capnocytophagoides TaxID=45254 RepID=UPI002A80C072